MATDYFIIMAVLFFFYFWLRWGFKSARSLPPSPGDPIGFDHQPIDASQLSDRIQQVREDLAKSKISSSALGFKRAQLVENKRAQLSRFAYFQTPPPSPEPPEQEHGLPIFLV